MSTGADKQVIRQSQPAAGDSSGGGTGSHAGHAYQLLRSDILSSVLAPNERLRLHDLRERYGLGIAPLREALVRLHGEQLVGAEEHRGYWVAPVSVEELRDLTRARLLLDAEALRGSIARGGEEWEARLVATFYKLQRVTERGLHLDPETMPEWELRHEDFHESLIAGDGSRLLFRLRSTLAVLVQRYRRGSYGRAHLEEHRGIMEAALGRNADEAVRLLTEHYELTTRTILERFKDEET